MELYRIDKSEGEKIVNAKYEEIDGKVVPKFITTTLTTKIYEDGKLLKKISPQCYIGNNSGGWINFLNTPDGEYFASIVATKADLHGNVEAEEVCIYDKKGSLLWRKLFEDYVFYHPYLFKYNETWYLVDLVNEGNINTLTFWHDDYQKTVDFGSSNITKVKTGLSGLLVLTDEEPWDFSNPTKGRKRMLFLIDYNGTVKWKNSIIASDSGSPKLVVNEDFCCLLYQFDNELHLLWFDENGKKIGNYSEKRQHQDEISVAVMDKTDIYFSKDYLLKQMGLKSMSVRKEQLFDKKVLDVFEDNGSVLIWQKRLNKQQSNNYSNYLVSVLDKDSFNKRMVNILLPKKDRNIIRSISKVNNSLIVVTGERIVKIGW